MNFRKLSKKIAVTTLVFGVVMGNMCVVNAEEVVGNAPVILGDSLTVEINITTEDFLNKLKALVKVTDVEDGNDLEWGIGEGNVNLLKVGTYEEPIYVEDSAGNYVEKAIMVNVVEKTNNNPNTEKPEQSKGEAPQIKLVDKNGNELQELNLDPGEDYQPYIKVVDKEDGVIHDFSYDGGDWISIEENTYEMGFSAIDSDGNVSKRLVKVNVGKKEEKPNNGVNTEVEKINEVKPEKKSSTSTATTTTNKSSTEIKGAEDVPKTGDVSGILGISAVTSMLGAVVIIRKMNK